MSTAINTHWSFARADGNVPSVTPWFSRSLNRSAGGAGQGEAGAEPSMRISDSARRWAASRVQGETLTQLQQNGARLEEAGELLARIGELKAFDVEATASEGDRAGYADEFAQLQGQLASLGGDGGRGRLVPFTTAKEPQAEMDEPAAAQGAVSFVDDFSSAENWVSTSGGLAVAGQTLLPNAGGDFGSVQSRQEFGGAFEIAFDLYLPGAFDSLEIALGGAMLSKLTDTENIAKWGWHQVRIAFDGTGKAATFLDGAETAADTQTEVGAAAGSLTLANYGEGSARLRNFSLTGGVTPVAEASDDDVRMDSNLAAVAGADDLATLDPATLAAAVDEVTAEQAENDAALDELDLTALTFDELSPGLAESTDEIASLGMAEELTEATRDDILRESGFVLLSQANIDEQSALFLLEAEG